MRLLLAFLAAAGCATQMPPPPGTPSGWISPTLDAPLAEALQLAGRSVDPARLAGALRELAARPHPPGSEADRALAEWVHARFLAAGLQSRIDQYEVLVPAPLEVTVEMLAPFAHRASMREASSDSDLDTQAAGLLPPHLAYSPDGEALGPLLYVHRATPQDFARLRDQGRDPRGWIGIARMGGVDPAVQVRHAAEAGLRALLLYSDPLDLGYGRGDPAPRGPWRPDGAAERASLLDHTLWPGDPLTPGEAALAGCRRIAVENAPVLPRIPAATLSAAEARPFLEAMGGPTVPPGWQGGLPFAYHLGEDRLRVRVRTASDWRLLPVFNVVGRLPGVLDPEAELVFGAARDGWNHAAQAAGSGTAVLVELARVLGLVARSGFRPTRSITLCSFGGTALGLLGSIEHVERSGDSIGTSAFAYVDLGAGVSGPRIRIEGSVELAAWVAQVPVGDGTRTVEPELDLLLPAGRGDHVGFMQHLGVPALRLQAEGPCGIIGTVFDTFGWMRRHGDPDFAHHAELARVAAQLALHGASATILPYDFAALARALARETAAAPLAAAERRELLPAIERLERAGALALGALAARVAEDPDPTRLIDVHADLRRVHRLFARPRARPVRPFFRSLLAATDPGTGTSLQALPALRAPPPAEDGGLRPEAAALREVLARAATALEALSSRIRALDGVPGR